MWAINKELSDVASSFLKQSLNPKSKISSNVGSPTDSNMVSTKGTIMGNLGSGVINSGKINADSKTISIKDTLSGNSGSGNVDSKRVFTNPYLSLPGSVAASNIDGSKRFSTMTGTNRATVFEVDQVNTGEDNNMQSQGPESQQQGMDFDQQSTIIDSSSTTPTNSFGESSVSTPEPTQSDSSSTSNNNSEGNVNLDKEILPVESNSYEPKINQKDSESEYRAVTPVSILKQQHDDSAKTPALRNLTDILKVFAKSEDNKPPIINSGSNDLTKILKVYGKDYESAPLVNRKKVIDTPKKFIESSPKPKHREPAIKVEYPKPKFLEFLQKPSSKSKDAEYSPSHGLLTSEHQKMISNDRYDDKTPVAREDMHHQDNSNNNDEADLHYDDVDESPMESKLKTKDNDNEERLASSRQLFDKKPKDKPMNDHMKAIGAVMEQNNKISKLVKQNGIGNINGLDPNKLPNHIIETNDKMMKMSETLFSNGKKSGPKENIEYPYLSLSQQDIVDSRRGAANFQLFSNGKKVDAKEDPSSLSLHRDIVDNQSFVDQNDEQKHQTDLIKSKVSLAPQLDEASSQTTTTNLGEDPFSAEPSTTNGNLETNDNNNDMLNSYAKLNKPQQEGKQTPQKTLQQKANFQQNMLQQKQATRFSQQRFQQPQQQKQNQQQQVQQLQQQNQQFQQPQQPQQQNQQQKQQPSKLAFLKKIPSGKPKGPSIAEFDKTFQTTRSEVKTKTKAITTGNDVAQSTSKTTNTDIKGQKDSSYSENVDGMKEQQMPSFLRHDPPRRQGSRNSYGTGYGQGYGYGKTSYGRGGGHAWAGDNYNNYQVPHFGLPDNEDSNNNQNKQQPTQGQSGAPGESQASQQQQTPADADVPNQDSAASAPIASPQPGAVASPAQWQEPSSPAMPQYTNKKLKPLVQRLPVKQVKETYKPPTKAESSKLNIEDNQENGEEEEENDEDENNRLLNKEAAPEHGKKIEQKIHNKLERPKGSKFSETATGSGYGTGYGNKESWGQGGGYAWAGKAPPKGAPNPADFMQKPAGMPDFPQVSGQTKGNFIIFFSFFLPFF